MYTAPYSSESFSKGVVRELVDEMEGVGFECYETDIGGDGAMFMEDTDEDTTQGDLIISQSYVFVS